MDSSHHNLLSQRERLATIIDANSSLIEQMKIELKQAINRDVDRDSLMTFTNRIKHLEKLQETIIEFDSRVMQYVNYFPENTPIYKDRLAVAKKYVEYLGGDWNTVLWGKQSDYSSPTF
jgi:hypothetical protein